MLSLLGLKPAARACALDLSQTRALPSGAPLTEPNRLGPRKTFVFCSHNAPSLTSYLEMLPERKRGQSWRRAGTSSASHVTAELRPGKPTSQTHSPAREAAREARRGCRRGRAGRAGPGGRAGGAAAPLTVLAGGRARARGRPLRGLAARARAAAASPCSPRGHGFLWRFLRGPGPPGDCGRAAGRRRSADEDPACRARAGPLGAAGPAVSGSRALGRTRAPGDADDGGQVTRGAAGVPAAEPRAPTWAPLTPLCLCTGGCG